MKCLLVRESADGEWAKFYDPIEGFQYEQGYLYELRVEVTKRAEPLADESSLGYRLVRVVSKQRP